MKTIVAEEEDYSPRDYNLSSLSWDKDTAKDTASEIFKICIICDE